jgi:hypothetical protein
MPFTDELAAATTSSSVLFQYLHVETGSGQTGSRDNTSETCTDY